MNEIRVGNHSIIIEDCLTYLKTMPARSVDVVCTSPPYNIGVNYHSYHDKKPRDAYIHWMMDIAMEIARVLKADGAYFLNMGSTNVDPWIQIEVACALRHLFVLQNHIIWAKSISIKGDTFGHFKPINSKRFLNHNHEAIFHFTLTGQAAIDRLAIGVVFQDKTNIARRGHAQDKRCGGNIWHLPYETVQSKDEKYNHPASFPIALPERCLRMHGGTEGVVLDPFLGTGATLLAAQRCGWKGIGIEIDQQYAHTANQRLSLSIKHADV
jgi:site-specific DNA-methyltransferase (adenine-specific)